MEKQLGKGTYGTVFKATDLLTKRVVALKYQKPPNKWEFYICRELQSRLANHPLRDRFMDVHIGYFRKLLLFLLLQKTNYLIVVEHLMTIDSKRKLFVI